VAALEMVAALARCVAVPFGSTCSGLGHAHSDLDIAIFPPQYELNAFEVLKRLRRHIQRDTGDFLQLIPAKRVPILHGQLHVRVNGQVVPVVVDISVGTDSTRHCVLRDGLIKAYVIASDKLTYMYHTIRTVFKANNVPDSKAGGINSLSIAMMCIFFMQNYQDKPMLPILQKEKEYYDWASQDLYIKWNRIWSEKAEAFKSKNQMSDNELMQALLEFIGKFDWENSTLSIRTGKAINRKGSREQNFSSERYCMAIEDPIDPTHNISMSLQEQCLLQIVNLCRKCAKKLRSGKSIDDLLLANDIQQENINTPRRGKRKSLDSTQSYPLRKTPRR
jgi:DNA polymerase sigma